MIRFENSYAVELEGLYTPWQGDKVPAPAFVKLNHELASELGLDPADLESPEGAALLVGSQLPEHATPLAQAYAGHQFGGYSPRLGDGRALLIGELIDTNGTRRDLHLKGSGRTPFSRGGDGKAAIGSVLREYLIGEFMHAAGIPSTRSLAALTTGETIMREGPLPGAVLARVASSHLRIGTFQFFAASEDAEKLRRLADYTIKRHDQELLDSDEPYLGLLRAVLDRQAALIAKWMGLGFVHGVMNTDNTTISGETIDYGPCAFIDAFDPRSVFSSIDANARYAYENQPGIAQWNLARFAETLLSLIEPADPEQAIPAATAVLEEFPRRYEGYWLEVMRAKLGLARPEPDDRQLIDELHSLMASQQMDFTGLFRSLSAVTRGDRKALYDLVEQTGDLDKWLARWLTRQASEDVDPQERAAAMDRVNPLYVPRNHKVEEALEAAVAGNFTPFETLLQLLIKPHTKIDGRDDFTQPAPSGFGPYMTYCGT
ncbi:MAG: hypothetical protein ACI8QS_002689 [Planctomycetota bacterium]|jgi:uncharacterized protein YdiU (UPF0061 family)